jgi:penicillin amidase
MALATIPNRPTISRDEHGVAHVRAADRASALWGLGFCQARDRGLQMLLMRILGQGRLAEVLDPSDQGVEIDRFFRRQNWAGRTATEMARLDPPLRTLLDSYCAGVNAGFARGVPWELRLVGYRHSPWTAEDSLLLARMMGYLTLAQSQAELERWLVEMVQAGVGRQRLEELFPNQLDGLDEELLARVTLPERIVPLALLQGSAVPRLASSNNWVVSGARTATGAPILANDPHLEANRLPNVWYEAVLEFGESYAMGVTVPGLPGVMLGRTRDLAWGATYAFLDNVDSWIEECRDGRCRRDGTWAPFRERKEVILRKRKPAVEVVFYENEHGVLSGDPHVEGFYLCTRWAPGEAGGRSLAELLGIWDLTTVPEAMARVGNLEVAFNWVLADRQGNIGYQMSGLLPRRRPGRSGLVPLPGWDRENDWQGFHDLTELPRCLNPASGIFVTANNDLNAHGKVRAINAPMLDYRAERIEELLGEARAWTPEDMFRIQTDVHSRQAAAFLAILGPLLPETPEARILAAWDFRYAPDSQGAFLFEEVYRALWRDVFGKGGLSDSVAEFLLSETGLPGDFIAAFDRVLLSEHSVWFGLESRDALFRRVAAKALEVTPRAWGEVHKLPLSHLLFGGKLPRFLGFDRGPITLPGGRATPLQGQIYRSANRLTSFVPTFRLVTDMSQDLCHTALLGGPSDRRFSRWYNSGTRGWLAGEYKQVKP